MRAWCRRIAVAISLTILVTVLPALSVSALAPQTSAFQRTWERTDMNPAVRPYNTWIWGPGGFSALMREEYLDAPGGWRVVQYFDKSRMEDNSYRASDAPWDVSNGLLVVELVTGRMQMGDAFFQNLEPAQVGVAGDVDDTSGVTYAFIARLLDLPAATTGTTITRRLTPASGTPYTDDPSLASYGVTDAMYVPDTQHTVASPFWNFMTASGQVYENGKFVTSQLFPNPYYATGLPITDAYWATIKVGGSQLNILVQCFERRCLTYNPANSPEWQVEMGNVGRHYYIWRHGTDIPTAPPAIEIGDYDPTGEAPLVIWPFDLGGEALVLLQNDSPFPLQITLDGPVSYTMTIDANPDRIVYPHRDAFPGCDLDGPTGEVSLLPGNYRVKFDFLGGNVTPRRGYWTLLPNAAYSQCYYVTEQNVSDQHTQTTGQIEITHIEYDSPVPNETSGESISLRNVDDHAIQMQGWRIVDAQDNTYTFPDFILGGGASVTVHNCTGTNDAANIYSGACEANWNNGGDTATLLDATGAVIDTYIY